MWTLAKILFLLENLVLTLCSQLHQQEKLSQTWHKQITTRGEKEFQNSEFCFSVFLGILSPHRLGTDRLKMSLHSLNGIKSKFKCVSHYSSNSIFTLPCSNFVSCFFFFLSQLPSEFTLHYMQYNSRTLKYYFPNQKYSKCNESTLMCWFVVITWFVSSFKCTTIVTLLVYSLYVFHFFLKFLIQMTIYCCVTKSESGLMSSRL